MKRIFEGKIYNTETADKIATVGDREGYDLYKTKRGNFFKLDWSRYEGVVWKIIPIDKKEAFDFFCEIADTETIDENLKEYFPEQSKELQEA
jgi:hypothetical protein